MFLTIMNQMPNPCRGEAANVRKTTISAGCGLHEAVATVGEGRIRLYAQFGLSA